VGGKTVDRNIKIIETVTTTGSPLKLEIASPTHKILQNATMAYNLKVSSLIRKGSESGERLLLRAEIEEHLVKSGIWSAEDSSKLQTLSMAIRSSELILQRGGIKLTDAKNLAIEMGNNRAEIMALVGKRQHLDSVTIESIAENFKFAHLAIGCIRFVENHQPFFAGYDDYINRGSEVASIASCKALAELVYGVMEDIQKSLFESRWLKQAGFINDDGRLINTNGHLVDEDGRLVDECGRFVNESDELIDLHGVRIEANGDFCCIDPKPFIDEDGNIVEIIVGGKSNGDAKKVSNKKRKRKAKV
jgi:hypothetical protein